MSRIIGIPALLLSIFAGCSSPVSAPIPAAAPAPANANGLSAMVSPGSRPNSVLVEYRNGTPDAVVVSTQVLVTGSLALEIANRNGSVIRPVPPSPPWPQDAGVRIPAGGTHRVEYALDMFDPALPPGRYHVRTRIEGWACEPLEYEVRAEQ